MKRRWTSQYQPHPMGDIYVKLKEVQEVLHEYGGHLANCNIHGRMEPYDCTCGFEEIAED